MQSKTPVKSSPENGKKNVDVSGGDRDPPSENGDSRQSQNQGQVGEWPGRDSTRKSNQTAGKASKSKGKSKGNANTEASRLEDQMNFEHLKLLESIFKEADSDSGGGLEMDEFRNAMKKTMGAEVCDNELEILFMKVDTNCDGTVDWDEYLSYMLLEYQEKDTMTSLIKEIPFPNPLKLLQSSHRDIIVRITFLQSLVNRMGSRALDRDNPGGKYLVLSKDGQLSLYGLDFDLQRTYTITSTKETNLALWLTDMVPCANVGLVAISSTEREISFFDVGINKFERKFQLTGFKDPVLTMDYWFNYDDLNYSILTVSDSNGSVIVFRFSQALRKGLFGVFPQKGLVRKIAIISIVKQRIPGAHCLVYENLHSNLVNSAQYFQLAQGLECFLSCSATDDDSMYLGDLSNVAYKPKWPGFVKLGANRDCYYNIRRGILALSYSKEWNLIVTGSFDGVVRTWNPGSSKPASVIKSHHSPIQHLTVIPQTGQIITCSKDKTIKVTELRDHSTAQLLPPRTFGSLGPSSHRITSIFYQKRYKVLVLGTTQVGVLEGFNDNENYELKPIKSHDGTVCSVLYNKLFNQVVTAGHDSVVSVWDLKTGVKGIQFHTIKGVEVTCMCFDQTGRRLITGSRNGAVKIWNFNNGACLKTLSPGLGYEITGIICHKQKVLIAGWNKKLVVCVDSNDPDVEQETEDWVAAHKDDILCLAPFQHSNGVSIVASCSYDGNIFIWSLDSGHILCQLNRLLSYSPLSSNGIKMDKPEKSELNLSDYARSSHSESSQRTSRTASQVERSEQNKRAPTILPPIHSQENLKEKRQVKKNTSKATITKDGRRGTEKKETTIIMPSAGGNRSSEIDNILKPIDVREDCNIKPESILQDKANQTKHRLSVLTGQVKSDYWEAEVSVERVLFLQSRTHAPNIATLLSSGAFGWIHAWSVHPQGGLLGQFVGAHLEDDVIVAMTTDSQNNLLFTGDTSGYIKIWNIKSYCIKKSQQKRRGAAFDLLQIQLRTQLLDEENLKTLSARRLHHLCTIPPDLIVYFRGHVGSISDIRYIEEKSLILTACSDGAVRLWTRRGLYIGTFGQKQSWNIMYPAAGGRMPVEVKRVASANTLKILNHGRSQWKHTKYMLKLALAKMAKETEENTSKNAEEEEEEAEEDEIQILPTVYKRKDSLEEIEKNYLSTISNLYHSDILGGCYKPKQRHRLLPKIDLKPHLNNFHVHSSIPFSPLQATEEIPVPEILKEKWRIQADGDKGKTRRISPSGTRVKGRVRNKVAPSQTSFFKAQMKVKMLNKLKPVHK